MTIRELLNLGAKKLESTSTSPSLDAEVLLAFVLKKPREYLFTHAESRIKNQESRKFTSLIKKRLAGWPVAYLIKQKEFFNLKFYVDENVLIPRPETEGLVELVLDKIKDQRSKIKILDTGTGSGCIIISLGHHLSPIHHQLFASDISPAALKVARRNAQQHQVKITFKQGDLLAPWQNQNFDIIVANLPYLARETDPSTKFEPKTALLAKKHGLALIKILFKQLSTINYEPSTVFLEIGHDQGLKIKTLAAKWLPEFETKIFKDLSGKNRYAVLKA